MASHIPRPRGRTFSAGAHRRTRRSRGDLGSRLLVLLVVPLLLTGCGLRFETPAPTEPMPNAVERIRARATADARDLHAAAEDARSTATPAVAAALDQTAADAARHVDELGGVYDSGLSPSAPAPTTSPTTSPSTATTVLALLTEAAKHSLADAGAVPDNRLARLLTSVTLARLQDARQLAVAAASPAPAATIASVPPAVPTGLTADQITEMVLSEDQAGFGFEVVAARLTDTARSAALARAVLHRDRAQQWAALEPAAADPRRVAYDLPDDLADPSGPATLAITLETGLATSYTTLVADVTLPDPAAADRLALVALADEAWSAALSWGAAPVALPALGEHG